ncbi:hypothetical protein [Metabacillus iocasae]|uniref:Type IV pilus assembly protein PilO n=1 Tax=Priestia iocasae TaxID=2291674 RepID=A0ABS2QPN4_9BACI|nr:hypothetical protein [Metabacillus iocasae]MBM7701360.1 type IV pilus assembly protein PilO [Metabacillus iocasae]
MPMYVSKKQWLIFLLVLLIVVGSVTVGYLQLMRPIQQEVSLIKDELKTEQQIVKALKANAPTQNDMLLKSSIELQKRLPVKPFTEQFMLELEKAEVVSDSLILSISFAADAELVVEKEENEVNLEEDATEEQPKLETTSELMPVGFQKITATLSVESKRYDDFLLFLKTIEQSSRISQIEGISFNGPQEATRLADVDKPTLQYELIVSTFYYPTLDKLQDQIPTIETPSPAGKEDPFQTLGNN